VIALSPLVLSVVVLAYSCYAPFTFTSARLNTAIFVLALGAPLLSLVWVRSITWDGGKILLTLLTTLATLSILLLIGVAPWLLAIIWLDIDPIGEKIRSIQFRNSHITVWRSNYEGALGSFGISVRQEQPFLPGVLRVRRLCEMHPAQDVDIQFIGNSRIRCSFPPYGERRPLRVDCDAQLSTWP
jgi:hypothetical protein